MVSLQMVEPAAGVDRVMLTALVVQGLHKTFTLHTQGGIHLPVLRGVDLTVYPGA